MGSWIFYTSLIMSIAVVSFFSGSSLYRFQSPGGSPLTRVCQVLVASIRKWRMDVSEDSNLLYEAPDKVSALEGSRKLGHTNELRFLDKASVISGSEDRIGDFSNPWRVCYKTQVEELKILVHMFPIWATGIVYFSAHGQKGATFIEQGLVMDPKVWSFTIPAASLSAFNAISVLLCVPLYDRAIVPIARKLTGNDRGFSQLQRMGIGLFISIFSMVVAALVETKRDDGF